MLTTEGKSTENILKVKLKQHRLLVDECPNNNHSNLLSIEAELESLRDLFEDLETRLIYQVEQFSRSASQGRSPTISREEYSRKLLNLGSHAREQQLEVEKINDSLIGLRRDTAKLFARASTIEHQAVKASSVNPQLKQLVERISTSSNQLIDAIRGRSQNIRASRKLADKISEQMGYKVEERSRAMSVDYENILQENQRLEKMLSKANAIISKANDEVSNSSGLIDQTI